MTLIALLSLLLPWRLRRRLLQAAFGYRLHPTSRIGLSWTFPGKQLVLEEGARIGHLNLMRGLDRVQLGPEAAIGTFNWITAIPTDDDTPRLEDFPERRSELILGRCAGITTRHYIDCSDSVTIGAFAVFGGLRSVILSHSIDVRRGRVRCAPISVGDYSLVLTGSTLVAGASLPDHSVLGAHSLLLGRLDRTHRLYAGSPAKEVGQYGDDTGWFHKTATRSF